MVLRHTLFAIIVCSFLVGPSALYVAQAHLKIPLHDCFTAAATKYLSGGSISDDISVDPSYGNIKTGVFQKNFSLKVEANIPARAKAILINAGIQRYAIKLSAKAFGIYPYPTFYGSERIYLANDDGLMYVPASASSVTEDALCNFGKSLASFADKHKGLKIHIVVADLSNMSRANPALTMISKPFDFRFCADKLRENIGDEYDISLNSFSFDSPNEYYQQYYRTDHHWNGFGAQNAYIATKEDVIGARQAKTDFDIISNEEAIMNGSLARTALDLLNEPIYEPPIDTNKFAYTSDAQAALLSYGGSTRNLSELESPQEEFDFYHFWYGPSSDTQIYNNSSENQHEALIVCDSYGSAFQWFVAEDYAKTSTFYDLHGSRNGNTQLATYLETGNISDLFLVGELSNIASLESRFPSFFS